MISGAAERCACGMRMATLPKIIADELVLEPFRAEQAIDIATWPFTQRDLYWLAPQTPPPLTPAKILAWQGAGRNGYVLRRPSGAIVAYGELNLLNGSGGVWWLGHLVVDPRQRGHGYGRELVERLIRRAFDRHGALRVTLVVFPENTAAIGCYRRVGMHEEGTEIHTFTHCGEQRTLVRMGIRAR
jgi:RimJ/RimL family protein N-acetyltransferase